MKHFKLESMKGGWFVGDFDPSIEKTKNFEVGIKSYKAGDSEPKHHHKVATEITSVVSGEIEMNGKKYSKGDMIVMEPGESCRFKALTDATNVVVKIPSVRGDKYIDEA